MIGLRDYFGPHWGSPSAEPYIQAATDFLSHVSALMSLAEEEGVIFRVNPLTRTQVAGSGAGGWRPADSPVGARRSAHKEGVAVDVFDPVGQVDEWCAAHTSSLADLGIHIEHPASTPGWSHWTTRPPASGKTVFWP